MRTLIRSGLLALEDGVRVADILIEGEQIRRIGENLLDFADETVDAHGLVVLPGAVDSHVHFYMKAASGGRNADDFAVGSAGAVAGGTTTVIDFATPAAGMSFAEAARLRIAEAGACVYTDFGLHMEVTGAFPQDFEGLCELPPMGVRALKIYTTYGKTELPRERLPELMRRAKALGMTLLAHCEDDATVRATKAQFLAEGRTSPADHAASRPAEAEAKAVSDVIAAAEAAGTRLIIAHISSAAGAEQVREARKRGADVHGETCPHYLLLTDACYLRDEPQRYIMTPPLRTSADNAALWSALIAGDIELVSTDHCPFPLADKLREKTCFEAIPGIGGVQSMPTLLFSEGYKKGRLTLPMLAARMATDAAKIYGLYPKKGAIRVGADADLAIFDPNQVHRLHAAEEQSRAGYTVFEGYEVTGRLRYTYLRGQLAAQDGRPVGEARGVYLGS